MKSKGRTAWLVTWEGPDIEFIGRCKVVAILPPQLGEKSIATLLPVLFRSESNYTLCEKMDSCIPMKKDPMLRQYYRDINPELEYGLPPKEYLCARKVKNLRCEENRSDDFESILYWTELPKFIPNPKLDPDSPLPDNPADWTKQVIGERDAQYTYSIRPSIEEHKRRREEKIRAGSFVVTPRE
jgi:hypothetical protein